MIFEIVWGVLVAVVVAVILAVVMRRMLMERRLKDGLDISGGHVYTSSHNWKLFAAVYECRGDVVMYSVIHEGVIQKERIKEDRRGFAAAHNVEKSVATIDEFMGINLLASDNPEVLMAVRNWLGPNGIVKFQEFKKRFGTVSPTIDGDVPHEVHFNEGHRVRAFLRTLPECRGWGQHRLENEWATIIEEAIL